ncbi:16S rRNA processing protein RimM [Collinsella sp. AGMB00827]|uniref:Ribosome maturation factor RimM n=1 Tax=Collinsella ureilytica TaxID=2869515 RepID=A0ABS7MLW9_9ACTN|nr:16S rRNA processing protein RimM [Collinsella urealyticum]
MRCLFRTIARIVKTHGSKGEVVAVAPRGLPFCLQAGLEVAIVPPSLDRDRFCLVESVSSERDRAAIIGFSGIHDLDAADSIVGCQVLASREDLALGSEFATLEELEGREVLDQHHGLLGTLIAIEETPAHPLWVVRDRNGRDILIPAVSAIILHVPDSGALEVSIPDGLLDLGANS